MTLDPYTTIVHRMMAAAYPDLGGAVTDAEEARRMYDKALFPAGPEEVRTEERLIGPDGIRVRIYRPDDAGPGLPTVVYFHGGGWVLCGLDSHDGACRVLAARTPAVVVSVEYRLSPEHRFPIPADDVFTVACWAVDHAHELGGAGIAVAGDSAGGALAAATCLRARDLGYPDIDSQLLIYPVTDCLAARDDTIETSLLTAQHMRWFTEQYLADPSDGAHPYASPLRSSDLTGLPPCLIITAEHDPLRDEGEAYAARLAEAGVPVAAFRVDGMFHGLFGLSALVPVARIAEDVATTGLREGLSSAHIVPESASASVTEVVRNLGVSITGPGERN